MLRVPHGVTDSCVRAAQALDRTGELTALGHHLASLPVDARVGKMLIHAAVLGCLDPVLTIAAMLSTRSPFVAPLDKRELVRPAYLKPLMSNITSFYGSSSANNGKDALPESTYYELF
eukprot:2689558-Pyramimonas_sp.AAC.1